MGHRRRWGWPAGVALLVLAMGAALLGGSGGSARAAANAPASITNRSAAAGPVPASIKSRYLTRTPPLGPVTVVDIASEPADRQLLAATFQGMVNRTQVRIYLRGARSYQDDQRWLDDYQARGLIHVVATTDLDTALHTFRSELGGYVMADPAEPWTLNTATTAAAALGGVVATPSTEAAVQAVGLPKLADHRGRWTDALTAYQAAAQEYRAKLAYQGLAIEAPTANAPRDFFVQQGVMTVFTRPSLSDFEPIYKLIDSYPSTHPVYGYVSDTGDEEVSALVRLASTKHWLVPSDTTDNLSFHLAVGGSNRATPQATAPVAPCKPTDVNVVLSFSDGDNLVVPEAHFMEPQNFGSPRRGEVPVGWGVGGSASVLMPAIWDHYITSTTAADEIVEMMGMGYALPSLMPDHGTDFLTDSLRQQGALGVPVVWSLDAPISKPDAAGWVGVTNAVKASGVKPAGMLFNYERWPGPAWYHSVAGFPALASQTAAYAESPDALAAQVQALVDQPASQRSLVTFFEITNWSTSYDQLADAMAPLKAKVRFLTPSQAFACLPAAPVPPTTTTTTPATSTTSPAATGPVVDTAPVAQPIAAAPTYAG